jgi:hypothetical protein
MPRRIDIELTSSREDGSWTWRAAGAKEPRGTVPGGLVPETAKVGDVLRVDAEFFVDGIEITGLAPAKGPRPEPQRLELLLPASEGPLVTSTVTSRPGEDRGPRRDRPRRDGPRREGDGRRKEPDGHRDRTGRKEGGDRGERPERRDRSPRRARPEPPPMPAVERPKAKRLRAGKAHRNALLESLPEEQRPIAEQVVLGGLPAVRQAIEKQNVERAAAGDSPIAAGPLLELAEQLVPRVRAAEWRDRAEAAQRDLEVIDLRDLRSVVSAADTAAKDDEARALAQALRKGLVSRADSEHEAWLAELTATVDVGRIVRALRLSSRPPKAGTPLPPELATRLTEGAAAALTEEAAPERWVAVLEALAFSPVRDRVIPTSLPKELHGDVRSTIARLATRIPKIAHIFEIAADRAAPRPKVERRKPKKQPPKPKRDAKPRDTEPKAARPPAEEPTPTDREDEPEAERPSADAPTTADGGEPDARDAAPPASALPAEDANTSAGPGLDAIPTDEPQWEWDPDLGAPAGGEEVPSGDQTVVEPDDRQAKPASTEGEPKPSDEVGGAPADDR